MDCDPEFRKELDRINAEMVIEREIAQASEEMQMRELFDEATEHGEAYSQGYQDGFWEGREVLFNHWDMITEASRQKHDELSKRWGLDNL